MVYFIVLVVYDWRLCCFDWFVCVLLILNSVDCWFVLFGLGWLILLGDTGVCLLFVVCFMCWLELLALLCWGLCLLMRLGLGLVMGLGFDVEFYFVDLLFGCLYWFMVYGLFLFLEVVLSLFCVGVGFIILFVWVWTVFWGCSGFTILFCCSFWGDFVGYLFLWGGCLLE